MPRASPVRDSLSAGTTSARVDWSAGASPNSTPVNSESAAATASTCQFNSARKVKLSRPFASSSVRNRMPQTANATPSMPPSAASSTLSVRSWRMIRNRPAPRLSRSAISRLRAAARASRRLAMFAHAMAEDQAHQRQKDVERLRIGPPQAVEAARSFPHQRAWEHPPAGASGSRRAPIAENGPASAACACAAVTPGRRRAIGTTQSSFGSR